MAEEPMTIERVEDRLNVLAHHFDWNFISHMAGRRSSRSDK